MTNFELFGIAALVPGMQHMLDKMQEELNTLRAQLENLQNGSTEGITKRRGRPSKALLAAVAAEETAGSYPASKYHPAKPNKKAGITKKGKPVTHPYWSKLTPQERKAEMLRRQEVRKAKAGAKGKKKPPQQSPTPERVGNDYTIAGAAKELGLTAYAVQMYLRRRKITPRLVPHPTHPGSKIGVMSARDVERLRKDRAANAGVRIVPEAQEAAA